MTLIFFFFFFFVIFVFLFFVVVLSFAFFFVVLFFAFMLVFLFYAFFFIFLFFCRLLLRFSLLLRLPILRLSLLLHFFYPSHSSSSSSSSSSSGITVLGGSQPLPKLHCSVLDPATYVSSSSRPCSFDLTNIISVYYNYLAHVKKLFIPSCPPFLYVHIIGHITSTFRPLKYSATTKSAQSYSSYTHNLAIHDTSYPCLCLTRNNH